MNWISKPPNMLGQQWLGFTPTKLPWEQYNTFNAGGALKPAAPFSFLWDMPAQGQEWTPGKGAPQGGDPFGSGSKSQAVKGFLQMLFGK